MRCPLCSPRLRSPLDTSAHLLARVRPTSRKASPPPSIFQGWRFTAYRMYSSEIFTSAGKTVTLTVPPPVIRRVAPAMGVSLRGLMFDTLGFRTQTTVRSPCPSIHDPEYFPGSPGVRSSFTSFLSTEAWTFFCPSRIRTQAIEL